MLRENQVRARIKACKIRIKRDKAQLSTYNFNNLDLVLKADLRYQKTKLKLLHRELPMRLIESVIDIGRCPICKEFVQCENYCHNCGQRVRE